MPFYFLICISIVSYRYSSAGLNYLGLKRTDRAKGDLLRLAVEKEARSGSANFELNLGIIQVMETGNGVEESYPIGFTKQNVVI